MSRTKIFGPALVALSVCFLLGAGGATKSLDAALRESLAAVSPDGKGEGFNCIERGDPNSSRADFACSNGGRVAMCALRQTDGCESSWGGGCILLPPGTALPAERE